MTPLGSALCGMGAGAAEAIIAVAPMETLKARKMITFVIHDFDL